VEQTSDWIWEIDQQGRFTYVSPQAAEITGYELVEILGHTTFDFMENAELERFQPIIEDYITQQLPFCGLEKTLIHKQGDPITLETSGSPIFDGNGVWQGYRGIARDITIRKQAEAEILRAKDLLASIFNESTDALFLVDPQTNLIQNCNQRAIELFEANHKSDLLNLEGHTLQKRGYTPEKLQTIFAEMDNAGVWNDELEYVTTKGNIFWGSLAAKRINVAGQPIHFVRLTDITERKKAEAELSKSERSLAETQRVANVGSWEFDRPTGEITWSAQTFRIFGLDPSQKEPDYTEFIQKIHPDDRTLIQQSVNRTLAEGTPYQMEYRMIRPDGQIRHLESRGEPVFNSEGEVIQLLGSVQDITERKQREQALRLIVEGTAATTGESFLRSCVGYLAKVLGVDYALICQRVHGRLTQVRSLAFWTGNTWSEPIEYDLEGTPCERVFDGQPCLHSENVQTEFPRDRILVDLGIESYFGAPLINSQGEIIGNLVVMDTKPMKPDPTTDSILQIFAARAGAELERQQVESTLRQVSQQEREKAEQLEQAYQELQLAQSQLVQQEKMASLGQLVAGVAHEINNPVSFIYGNIMPARVYANDLLQLTALYQKHYPTPPAEIQGQIELIELEFIQEDFPKLLESMEEGSTRIQGIVRSLRNFSRLDEAKRKPADLHQGIESTLMILQHRLKEQPKRAEIQVIKQFCDLPLVQCYPGELNQVFMNLFSNAIDALEERIRQEPNLTPKLQITTQVQTVNGTSPHKAIIRVADNGVGMPACVQQRLFDPFFTTKPVGQGTGLGLSIAHSIVVRKHKGQLYCNSSVGEGTEFVIELPVSVCSHRTLSHK